MTTAISLRAWARHFSERVALVDSSNLKEDFAAWPDLARRTWRDTKPVDLPRKIDFLILAGMGGSGIIGDLLADIANETKTRIPFLVIKDYHLPDFIGSNTLVIGISCSGNTEETLSVLNEAASRGLRGSLFGTGGLLERFSKEHDGFQFTRTSMLKVPRSSFPAIFYAVLKTLSANKFIKVDDADVEESIESLASVYDNASTISTQNAALNIAKNIVERRKALTPLVYASRRTRAVGMRFRQSLNENSKIHTFDGVIPELCHNDIVGWDAKTASRKLAKKANIDNDYSPVLLRLKDDPPEVKTRFDIVSQIVKRSNVRTVEAPHIGKSYLSRIISMLYWLDYTSYYVSIIRGIDPIKTPSIDLLKAELKTRLNYLGTRT